MVGNGGHAVVCFTDIRVKNAVEAVARSNRGKEATDENFLDPLSSEVLKRLDPPMEGSPIDYIEAGKVTLLDFYYVAKKTLAGTRSLVEEDGRDFRQIVDDRTRAIRDRSAFIFRYRDAEKALPLENFFPSQEGVYEIADMGEIPNLGERCSLVQLARQWKNVDRFQVEYDERLFERMDPVSQAGLVYHERLLWLRKDSEGRSKKIPQMVTTEKIRQLNALIFSRSFEQISGESFKDHIQNSEIYSVDLTPHFFVEYKSKPLLVVSADKWPNGQWQQIDAVDEFSVDVPASDQKITAKFAKFYVNGSLESAKGNSTSATIHGVDVYANDILQFTSEGMMRAAQIHVPYRLMSGTVLPAGTFLSFYPYNPGTDQPMPESINVRQVVRDFYVNEGLWCKDWASFSSDGKLMRCSLSRSFTQGRYTFAANREIILSPKTQQVLEGHLAGRHEIALKNYSIKVYDRSEVAFYDTGELRSVWGWSASDGKVRILDERINLDGGMKIKFHRNGEVAQAYTPGFIFVNYTNEEKEKTLRQLSQWLQGQRIPPDSMVRFDEDGKLLQVRCEDRDLFLKDAEKK